MGVELGASLKVVAHVPHNDPLVAACRREQRAVGREGKEPHLILVAAERAVWLVGKVAPSARVVDVQRHGHR
jgi:hypothetical protein